MPNEEIITSLKNGAQQGESLQDTIQSLINSGYNPQEVQEASDFTTQLPGGKGAVRETIEVLLRSRGCWENLVQNYQGNGIA